MADRVHPRDSPPLTARTSPSSSGEVLSKPSLPAPSKPVASPTPPPGTYVIQVPKDQIYKYPPRENGLKYQNYSSRKSHRSCCCRCFCWSLCFLLVLIVAVAAAAGILYLTFRPKALKYTITDIAIGGFNLTSSAPMSPEIDVTFRADNPNDKIGIYYEKDSSVDVFYSDIDLCDGALPSSYQPSNNVTLFQAALRGSNIVLSSVVESELVSAQRQTKVPLRLKLKAPVKIKVGSVRTWTIIVKVICDMTVDSLTADSKIVSKDCHWGVKLW